ncbi:hypothetical protein [Candidatus Mesenet endosymbiont of Phosphuga atrata]|uniref:hypothetical protein n=1 Tax=Candidatus Mesenet endosymbiont of Phosphuga atrata TaxID=3066221 RepID=UPI0030CBD893
MEYRFDSRYSNEQDESKTQANDSNDIVTLKTRLKRLTDCVKSNCNNSYYYDNPQIVRDDGKPQKVLATSFMQNGGTDCANFPPLLESPEGKNGFAPSTIQLTSNGFYGRS